MTVAAKIKNWHREEFKAGQHENLPVDVLEALKAEDKPQAVPAKEEVKLDFTSIKAK